MKERPTWKRVLFVALVLTLVILALPVALAITVWHLAVEIERQGRAALGQWYNIDDEEGESKL